MPVKDGYDSCKEIRQWEQENHVPNTPIVALSANVLGDVYAKCVDAGFSSYVTKPVDFQEIGNVLHKFLDAENPARHEFLKLP
jgi:CheY-like chemotaxis protein